MKYDFNLSIWCFQRLIRLEFTKMKSWFNTRYFYFADDVHLLCKKPQRSNFNTDIQMAELAMTNI